MIVLFGFGGNAMCGDTMCGDTTGDGATECVVRFAVCEAAAWVFAVDFTSAAPWGCAAGGADLAAGWLGALAGSVSRVTVVSRKAAMKTPVRAT